MGFAVATRLDHPTVWRISGKIESFSVEIRPYAKHFGATGFYGFMQLAVEVRSPSGTSEMENIKLYGMHRFYNGGYGLRDEVKDCMGRFIIESAQETLARLNRKLFGARPHPEVETMLQALERTDKKIPPNRLHAIGLSGHPHAMGVLLDLLSDEKDVRTRRNLINALATLASPEAFESLSARYADEDEDCRYFILKAMEYIGSEETRGFVRERGTEDDDLACRRLVWHAERVGTH